MKPPTDVTVSLERDKSEELTDEGCYILESWNDPSDPEVSIARARVPAGKTTRLHCLDGATERYVVLSGRGVARAGDRDRIELGPGDVLVIPPGAAQLIAAVGAEDLIFTCVCSPRFTPDRYVDLEDAR